MAIERIDLPEAVPSAVSDYEAQNDQIDKLWLNQIDIFQDQSGVVPKGYTFYLGGTPYLGTSDTTITGTESNYIQMTPSGDGSTCSAAYVTDLTGFTWNDTYNGYYDGSGNLCIVNEFVESNDGVITAPKTQRGIIGKEILDGYRTQEIFSGDDRFLESTSKTANVSAFVGGSWATIGYIPSGRFTIIFNTAVYYTNNKAQYSGHFYVSGYLTSNLSTVNIKFSHGSHLGDAIEVGRVRVIYSADSTERGLKLQMEMIRSAGAVTTSNLNVRMENLGNDPGDYMIPVTPISENSPTLPDGSTSFSSTDDWWRFGQGETELWTGNTSIANGATGYITLPIPPENRFRKYRVECSFISGGVSGYGQMNAEPISPKLSAGYSPQDFGFLISTSQYFIASVRGSGEGSNPSSIQVQNVFGGTIYVQRVVGVI